MNKVINTYNSVKNAAQSFNNQASKNLKTKEGHGPNFADTLNQVSSNFINDIHGLEDSMQKMSNGDMSPEDVVTQTKAITLEAEGFMAITRSLTESLRKMFDMQL